jgi:hypothetical protein
MFPLVEIKRYSTTPESTLGLLYLSGHFRCYTLEDTKRPIKKAGATRIHDGIYFLDLRKGSRMANRYQKKYSWHKWGMIWIRGVPEFEWIYLHPGQTSEQTLGCPLLGDRPNNNTRLPGYLYESVRAYKPIYEMIAPILDQSPMSISIRISNLG